MSVKDTMKQVIPPIFLYIRDIARSDKRIYYFGDYKSFDVARKASKEMGGDYSNEAILRRVAKAIQAVIDGRAVFERDGLLFYEPCNNYELMSAFLYAVNKKPNAQRSGTARAAVLDYGGALGSIYFQYKELFDELCVTWAIIEQQNFVSYGRGHIPQINFFDNLGQYSKAWDSRSGVERADITIFFSSSTFMYLPDPYHVIKEASKLGFDYFIIDRTDFLKDERADDRIVIEHVPRYVYGERCYYPARLFGLDHFRKFLKECGWHIKWEWNYKYGMVPIKKRIGFEDTMEKGFLLVKD